VTSPAGSLRISPSICYEDVLPQVIRGQIRFLADEGREPHVLVNLTNDGWFWGSSELDMHLVCAVFRAVEFRKPVLVAANTGLSAWIDGDGRILARGPRREKTIILAEVGPDPRCSWYLRIGDWPAGCCLGACVVLAGVGWWARRVAGTARRNSLLRKG
jgi:apolipoprotein N-acyltransferase